VDRILLIEDDAGAQLLFRNRLKELGYEVVVAATGARGLLEARAGKFDLFLVDIGLGSGIDGYEVCRRLKGMPQIHGIPVVLISGQVKSQDELHRGYEAGCEAFLVKGDLTLIEDAVRAMLRIKSLQDELALQNRLLEERNRHLREERERGADLEIALRESGSRALVFRELAAGRPDGLLVVDAEGVVRMTDRGAQDILGKDLEGRHLASLAPGTGLEAFVRNARTEPHEEYRFDLEWSNGAVRSLSASIMPTVPRVRGGGDPGTKIVLLLDAGKRRVAGEMLRLEDHGIPRRELGPLLEAAHRTFNAKSLIGTSSAMKELRAKVASASKLDGPLLVRGEAGTGKELVARVLHFGGQSSGPFVPVNCSALAPTLLESELFGHVKGAFPEAISDRPGLFQQAQDGTIFLDEVGKIPPPLQEKLLEVLEKKRVRRRGSMQFEPVDVRVLAATSVDLGQLVTQGKFREDLYDRLREVELLTTPLRKRDQDVLQLARHFLELFGGARDLELSSEVEWVLEEYDWPGNVGELESCIDVACAQAAGNEITVADLSTPLYELYKRRSESDSIPRQRGTSTAPQNKREALTAAYTNVERLAEKPSLEAYEKQAILHALSETNGDKLAAARLLQIGKSTFYRKLKSHGLS
jgi:DNA-binding NtrC family response regulator